MSLSIQAYISSILLWAFALLVEKLAFCGTVIPVKDPIYASIANTDEFSTYRFKFMLETQLPPGGTVIITFPSQFLNQLGISLVASDTCNFPCSVDGRDAIFSFINGIAPQTVTEVVINGVLNPQLKGGTGNFIIKTMRFQTVFDQNLQFGVFGFAQQIPDLSSARITLDESQDSYKYAGNSAVYRFYFKVPVEIPKESFVKLTFPKQQQFSISSSGTALNCQVLSLGGIQIPMNITCEKYDDYSIAAHGFLQNLPIFTQGMISVTVTNPIHGTSDTSFYQLAIVREGTQLVYTWRYQLDGPVVLPAAFQNVVFKPINTAFKISQEKKMLYFLNFTTKNPLLQTSIIRLEMPFSWETVVSTSYDKVYVESGLLDFNSTSPIKITYLQKSIEISNFQQVNANTAIVLNVMLKSPPITGISQAILLRTYLDTQKTRIVDEDSQSLKVTVAPSTSPLAIGVTSTNTIANGNPTSLTFSFTPAIFVPTSGTIQIIFPTDFAIGTLAASNCQIKTAVNAASCSQSGSIITIKLTGAVSYAIGVTQTIVISGNIITNPIVPSTYTFDLTTFQADGTTLLQSYTDFLTLTPRPLSVSSGTLIGCEKSNSATSSYQYSTLLLTFITIYPIPQGMPALLSTDEQGSIELEFTTGGWDPSFGFSTQSTGDSIPCVVQTGLVPISGTKILCYLVRDTIPKIVVKNFQAIAGATSVGIFFAKLLNPEPAAATFTLTLRLQRLKNRVETVINSAIVTPNMCTYALITPTTQAKTLTFSTAPNNYVLTTFSLNIVTFPIAAIVAVNSYLLIELPTFDIGFLTQTITCQVNTVAYSCYSFNEVGYILYDFGAVTIPVNPTIDLSNLKWPTYSYSAGMLKFTIFQPNGGGNLIEKQKTNISPAFPSPTPGLLSSSSISYRDTAANLPNAKYVFKFTFTNDIPYGGGIQLTFPPTYGVSGSVPPPVVVFNSGVMPIPQSEFISVMGSNYIWVTNINTYPANTEITMTVTGVLNPILPGPGSSSTGWTIQSTYDIYTVNRKINFDTFVFTSTFSPNILSIKSISIFPQNANEYARYRIQVLPVFKIPKQSEIHYIFSSQQYNIPNPPKCRLSGALTSYKSCVQIGSTIIVTTDEDWDYTKGNIVFQVDDILNPNIVGKSDPFTVKTRYDSIWVDITDESLITNRYVDIKPVANTISIIKFDFFPRNEAEESNYIITFLPQTVITSGHSIIFTFPIVYDRLLADTFKCVVLGGFKSTVICNIKDGSVVVIGLTYYQPSAADPISLQFVGIVNPNALTNGHTGKFQVGVILIGSSQFLDLQSKVSALETTKAASWTYLKQFYISNYNSRVRSIYTFTIKIFMKVPSKESNGMIIMRLPNENYDVPPKIVECSTPNVTTFASSISCNTLDNFVYIEGNPEPENGLVQISVANIDNAVNEGTINDIVFITYDGFNKYILEKTFKNLDPARYKFTYLGPIFSINKDLQITIQRGTQSDDIFIQTDYPCALDLIFQAAFTSGLQLIPANVPISRGYQSSKFRIAVPQDLNVGEYYIYWETLNELIPPVYTPLAQTVVIVTAAASSIISFSQLNDIPVGGSSLDVKITLSSGAAKNIRLNFVFDKIQANIVLSHRFILFDNGQREATFRVDCFETAAEYIGYSGKVLISMDGDNARVFTLSKTQIPFKVIEGLTSAPQIQSLELDSQKLTQTSFDAQITCSEISKVYYMVALNGTNIPPPYEIQEKGPSPYQETQSTYFQIVTDSQGLATLSVTGLAASTSYVLYAFAQNRAYFQSEISTLMITTQGLDRAAKFQTIIKKEEVKPIEIKIESIQIAFLLSLAPEQVLFKKLTNFIDSKTSKNYTRLDWILQTDPQNNDFPPTINLVQRLEDRQFELAAQIPALETSGFFDGQIFLAYTPNIIGTPEILSFPYSFNLTVKVDNQAYLFGVAIPLVLMDSAEYQRKGFIQSPPSAIQIYLGYSGFNIPHPHGSVLVDQKNEEGEFIGNLTIPGLTPSQNYTVYIVAGSTHPGMPDLMDDKDIITLNARSEDLEKKAVVSSKISNIIQIFSSILLLGLSFMYIY